MTKRVFNDGSDMVLVGESLTIHDADGETILDATLQVDLPEDQAFMMVAAVLQHDGERFLFSGGGFYGSEVHSLMTFDTAFDEKVLRWASEHLEELKNLRSGFVINDEVTEAEADLLAQIGVVLEGLGGIEHVGGWEDQSNRIWCQDLDGRRFSITVEEIHGFDIEGLLKGQRF
jgi:hypothetical protein